MLLLLLSTAAADNSNNNNNNDDDDAAAAAAADDDDDDVENADEVTDRSRPLLLDLLPLAAPARVRVSARQGPRLGAARAL